MTFRCEILISLTTFGFLAFAVLIIAKVYSVYKSCRNSLFLCIQHCEKWTLFVLQTVQQRGAAVIQARKLSSAMSAAKATGDHLRDWWNGTKQVGTFWLLLDFIHFGIFFLPLPVGSLEMKHLGLVENVFYCFYWWCWVAIKGAVSWGKASGWSRALCSFLECSVMEQVEEVN